VDFLKKTTADTAVPQFFNSFSPNRATSILSCATAILAVQVPKLHLHG